MQLTTLLERQLLTPCQADTEDLWFSDRPADVEQAKALCAECPVQAACLDGALDRREPWGVWGGELFEAGRVIPRKVPRGRPRKDDPRYLAAAAAKAAAAAAEGAAAGTVTPAKAGAAA